MAANLYGESHALLERFRFSNPLFGFSVTATVQNGNLRSRHCALRCTQMPTAQAGLLGMAAQLQSRARHDQPLSQSKRSGQPYSAARFDLTCNYLLDAAANLTLTRMTSASFAIAIWTIAAYARAAGTCACFGSSVAATQATRSNWLCARHCASTRTTFAAVTRTSDTIAVGALAVDTGTSRLNTDICYALAVRKVRKRNSDHNK